jgi:hypothetical protein
MSEKPHRPPQSPPPRPSEASQAPEVATTPAQERGERIVTGKTIARGGKQHGAVPGATESSASPPQTDAR